MENGDDMEADLRMGASVRKTDYTFPPLSFEHEPINRRECEQMHNLLRDQVALQMEKVKRQQKTQQIAARYAQIYEDFAEMSVRNQAQETQMCNQIKNMHEMADILIHPPPFGTQLFLYLRNSDIDLNKQQTQRRIEQYEAAYAAGDRFDKNEAEEVIRRAKQYLRKGR